MGCCLGLRNALPQMSKTLVPCSAAKCENWTPSVYVTRFDNPTKLFAWVLHSQKKGHSSKLLGKNLTMRCLAPSKNPAARTQPEPAQISPLSAFRLHLLKAILILASLHGWRRTVFFLPKSPAGAGDPFRRNGRGGGFACTGLANNAFSLPQQSKTPVERLE